MDSGKGWKNNLSIERNICSICITTCKKTIYIYIQLIETNLIRRWMEFMKANRKFKSDKDDAVSAVIGVILMVAITVAIAATVYVYVSGMIGTSPETTPSMQFVKDSTNTKLTVASADPGNLNWDDFEITWTNTDNVTCLLQPAGTSITSGGTLATATVTAGQYLDYTVDPGFSTSISIRHVPTNTLIGSWEFS